MNLVKKLNELQEIDLKIKKFQEELNEIYNNLSSNTELVTIKNKYSELTANFSDLRKRKKDLEWEIEELNKNILQINSKLYGGTVRNPKELLSLEQDLAALKKRLIPKEDLFLDMMGDEESIQDQLNTLSYEIKQKEEEWEIESDRLLELKSTIETKIDDLYRERKIYVADIDTEALKIYERLVSKKGYAIVRVEQGRCQGCRIALPMNDLQRARSGSLVQCSSCGMILFL